MSAISESFSVSPDRPVDPTTRDTLSLIQHVFQQADIPYMLVGATARDLLLFHVFGEQIRRATYDLDFAVLVDSWHTFSHVKQLLIDRYHFRDEKKQAQRMYYRPSSAAHDTVIDIIPFGDVASDDGKIAWPPDADVVMNVIGFSDVFDSVVTVDVDEELSIPVTSLFSLRDIDHLGIEFRDGTQTIRPLPVKSVQRLTQHKLSAGGIVPEVEPVARAAAPSRQCLMQLQPGGLRIHAADDYIR